MVGVVLLHKAGTNHKEHKVKKRTLVNHKPQSMVTPPAPPIASITFPGDK